MITQELLTSKGTIQGIVSLSDDESGAHDLDAVTEEMGLSSSTARERLEDLSEEGLVEQSAEMVDNTPKRVFSLTDEGEQLAENLEQILE
jgi:predicted ArsR family transcriptional regulator